MLFVAVAVSSVAVAFVVVAFVAVVCAPCYILWFCCKLTMLLITVYVVPSRHVIVRVVATLI